MDYGEAIHNMFMDGFKQSIKINEEIQINLLRPKEKKNIKLVGVRHGNNPDWSVFGDDIKKEISSLKENSKVGVEVTDLDYYAYKAVRAFQGLQRLAKSKKPVSTKEKKALSEELTRWTGKILDMRPMILQHDFVEFKDQNDSHAFARELRNHASTKLSDEAKHHINRLNHGYFYKVLDELEKNGHTCVPIDNTEIMLRSKQDATMIYAMQAGRRLGVNLPLMRTEQDILKDIAGKHAIERSRHMLKEMRQNKVDAAIIGDRHARHIREWAKK